MKTEYKTIKVEIKDGVAVLTMNNPPVNQLSPDFSVGLGFISFPEQF
jgi:enoyl-CoA hydratase/carnithine racemase